MKARCSIAAVLILLLGAPALKAQKIDWMTWEEAIHAHQNQEAKKIFVDIYTDWCGWCKKMDRTTFSDPEVVELMNEHYYPVKFDAEQKDPVIMGNDTLELRSGKGKNGTHELALNLLNGNVKYPASVVLNEKLQVMLPQRGYLKPHQMKAVLAFFGEDHHQKGKDLNEFIKKYPDNIEQKENEKEKKENKGSGKNKEEKKKAKKKDKGKKEHPVDWLSWKDMVELQEDKPRYVFIDLYTDWCGPCKLLDKRTFHDTEVAEFLNKNFHPVKFNAETKDTIRFQGRSYKNSKPESEKSRGNYHELAAKLVDGRLAYPTMIVLDREWGRVKMMRGVKKPDQLLKELRPLIEQEGDN